MAGSFTDAWNSAYEAIPADTEYFNMGANRIRDLKLNIREREQIDHWWNGDANDGKHHHVTLINTSAEGAPALDTGDGSIYALTANGITELFYKDSNGNQTQITTAGAVTGNYLPLSGGTLTGALGGTTVSMSGSVTAGSGGVVVTANNSGLTIGTGTTSYVAGDGAGRLTLHGPSAVQIDATAINPIGNNATGLGASGYAWNGLWMSDNAQVNLGTGGGNIIGNPTGQVIITPGGASSVYVHTSNAGFLPYVDNNTILGTTGNRWISVYAVNGTIQTCDLREKKDVEDCDLGLDFITGLRPVSYRWKRDDGRGKHYGFIAQEIELVLDGQSFAGLNKPTREDEFYGLSYTELVAPIVRAVSELRARVEALEEEIARLRRQ